MDVPTIRPANLADIGAIAALMHAGMSPLVQRITILGSPLLSAFVAAQIGSPSGDRFTVAEAGGQIAGVAAWRQVGTALILNHLYVQEDIRGHGIGTLLLSAGLQMWEERGVQTVEVDVFSESQRVGAWYAALGMEPQYRRSWLETTLPAPRSMSGRKCTVEGLEQADLDHARQGFSQFKLITFNGEYAIGRLAEAVFRTGGLAILADRPALEALGTLDARRSLVCFAPPEALCEEMLRRGRVLTESERLTCAAPRLAATLQAG